MITIHNFEKKVDSATVSKGLKYFREKRVLGLMNRGRGLWTGNVLGSHGNYRVELSFQGIELIHAECDCPHDAEICKHVVALMVEVKQKHIFSFEEVTPENAKTLTIQIDTVEEKYTKYLVLPADVQYGLRILALYTELVTANRFMEVCSYLDFRYNGLKLTTTTVRNFLDMLHKEGFLEFQRSTNKWQMPADIAEHICRNAFIGNMTELDKVISGIRRKLDLYYIYYMGPEKSYRLLREARFAYYLNDAENFQRCFMETITQSEGKEFSHDALLQRFLPNFKTTTKSNFIRTRHEKIQVFLFIHHLNNICWEMSKPDELYNYVLENLDTFSKENVVNLTRIFGQIGMFRGDWALVKKVAVHFDNFHNLCFVAWQKLLRGEVQHAMTVLAEASKEQRRITHNPKSYLTGFVGIVDIMAKFKTQDTSFYKTIGDFITRHNKKEGYYTELYKYPFAMLQALQSDKESAKALLHNRASVLCFDAFRLIAQYNIDASLPITGEVKRLREYAEKTGNAWIAAELEAIVARHENRTIAPFEIDANLDLLKNETHNNGIELWIDTLPRVEDWEIALRAMMGIFGDDGGKTPVENTTRLVWLIDFNSMVVQPKEQIMKKTGWTSGRNVAWSRLAAGEVTALTEQDRRILRHLQAHNTWRGSEYELDLSKAIPDFAGHPLLFLYNSPSVAVQLVKEEPTLILSENSVGYQLSFSHKIDTEGIQIVKETPTRYKFLKITAEHARLARLIPNGKMTFPRQAQEQLQGVIQRLSSVMLVQSAIEADHKDLPSVEADARVCVHLLPIGDGFSIELYVKPFGSVPPYLKAGEGEAVLIADVENVRTRTKRNLKLEKQNTKKFIESIAVLNDNKPVNKTWALEDSESCLQFLLDLRPLLDDKSVILEWPKGEKFKIAKVVDFSNMQIAVNRKNDWFEVSGKVQVDENLVLDMKTLIELSNQSRSGQFLELSNGQFLALTNAFRKRLDEIAGFLNPQKDGTFQMHPLVSPILAPFTEGVGKLEMDKKYKESVTRLEKAFKKKFAPPADFKADLRPYQQEGFEWLSRAAEWGVGVVLADDMGLGKTVQGLALIQNRASAGPSLVVAPASVCRNWIAETQKFTPSLKPILFGEGDRTAMIEQAGANDLVVVTYDLMTRESELFTNKKFVTVILDEAQAIKNRSTKRSETAMSLQADFKIAMTGTPLENHLGELWNLFQFANPGFLGSIEDFNNRFAMPIERNGDELARHQLRRLVQPFMLRRRKDEVLKDLPEKTEIVLTVELSSEERAFYEALRRKAAEQLRNLAETEGLEKNHLQVLAEIMRLRRAACHPRLVDEHANFIESAKLKLFGEIVEELRDNGHKALVFSQFVAHLTILREHLDKNNIPYQYLDGSTPLPKRQKAIEAFQAGEGDLFLISLKAGGVGLNLTAADYVLHMDPWWNPAVEDQATDRAHRIGQERPVTVYRFVTENTIEEKIIKLHETKRDLADSLLEGSSISARLSANELLALISDRS